MCKAYVPDSVIATVWIISFHDEFELDELPEEIQDELFARLKVLAARRYSTARPSRT